MSMSLLRFCAVGILLGGFLAPDSKAQNILKNPSFATVPNAATDWTLSLGAFHGTPGLSHDGDGYVLTFQEDQTPISGWAKASQTLAAAPGQEWIFSGWAFYPSGMFLHEDDYALLDITFKTSSGETTSIQSPRVNLSLESTWMPLSQTAVAPADTTEVTLSAQFYHGDTWVSGRLYFDDFSAQGTPAIPEPGIMSFVCLSILWVLKRRIFRTAKK